MSPTCDIKHAHQIAFDQWKIGEISIATISGLFENVDCTLVTVNL
jgi:hypothetical protein